MSTKISLSTVSSHKSDGDAWIIINGNVYDVSKFLTLHPGGKKVLLNVAGTDATKQFEMFHKASVLEKYANLKIGTVEDEGAKKRPAASSSPSSSSPSPAAAVVVPVSNSSPSTSASLSASMFGELIPYSDPSWYQGWYSPYYNASHLRLRTAVRAFVDSEILPFCNDWDEAKAMPTDIWKKAYAAGILPGLVGAPWPTHYAGSNVAGGIKPEEFDYFHELILVDELSRCGSGGCVWGLSAGLTIGLPPLLHFASPELRGRVCPPCLRGEKFICLAITEPYAGSDVANIQCSAKRSEDGRHFIVNGEKKWITNGVFCDYFTVAVRTGGKGMGGISLLLVERSAGVSTRQMNCSGVWSSGTTYLVFEDVKVPVENLIGKENEGFKYIMHNFNHERFWIVAQATRFARVCLEESFKYALKRRTFGKLLIEHPVIRMKLAHMARQVEATQTLLESITYQLCRMSKEEANIRLGGAIAGAKAQSTQVFELCAREAAQIFGGLAYTRGGQGEKVERLYREVRAYAVPAGSEEIMLDLSIKQAVKNSVKTKNVAKL